MNFDDDDDDDDAKNPMEEILRALASGAKPTVQVLKMSKKAEQPEIPDADRITALIEGLERYSVKHAFKPGDIIVGKPNVSGFIKDNDKPHIVVRLLDKPAVMTLDGKNIGLATTSYEYDIVIAGIGSDGKTMVMWLSPSAIWEPYRGH